MLTSAVGFSPDPSLPTDDVSIKMVQNSSQLRETIAAVIHNLCFCYDVMYVIYNNNVMLCILTFFYSSSHVHSSGPPFIPSCGCRGYHC